MTPFVRRGGIGWVLATYCFIFVALDVHWRNWPAFWAMLAIGVTNVVAAVMANISYHRTEDLRDRLKKLLAAELIDQIKQIKQIKQAGIAEREDDR